MNKELEEAVEWLKNNIKYYQEQLKIISALDDSDYYDEETKLYKNRIRIFETVLNYIENSISKEVIEEKIKILNKKEKEELKGTKGQDRYFIKQMYNYQRKILQELLEGK